jgi:hypothetical protein
MYPLDRADPARLDRHQHGADAVGAKPSSPGAARDERTFSHGGRNALILIAVLIGR